MRARAFFGLGLCALTWSSFAHADFALSWSAPRGCPDRAGVLQRMTRLLGRPPGGANQPQFSVRGEVTELSDRADRGFRVRLVSVTADGPSERTIDGVSCERVTDAAVLILAMAIDAEAVAARLSAPPAPPAAAERGVPRKSDGPRIGYFARAGALADAGALPEVSPGLALGLAISVGKAWFEVEGRKWFAQNIEAPDRPGIGGRFNRQALALRGCLGWDLGSLSAGPCAGGSVGWMTGQGYGISDPDQGGNAWIEAFAGGALRQRASELFALRLDLEAAVPLVNPRFSIGGIGSIHRAQFVHGRGGVALELHFR